MHIVVVGAGKIGSSASRWLVSAGHEIAVVEIDRSKCAELDEALGEVSVHGDAADAGVLAKAGASRADVLIATTSSDDLNLVACQLAKQHFGVLKTISVVNSLDHTGLFNTLGIDVTIDVTNLVLDRIQGGLSAHSVARLMPVSDRDGKALVSVKIPPDFAVDQRLLKDLPLPEGCFLSLVISRDGSATIPTEGTAIRAGDEVVAVTSPQDEEELRDLLIEGSPE